MARYRRRHDTKSDSSQLFRTESEANDSDSEADVSTPESSMSARNGYTRVFPVKKRKHSKGSSTYSSSGSDDDGGRRAVRKRRNKKTRSAERPEDMSIS